MRSVFCAVLVMMGAIAGLGCGGALAPSGDGGLDGPELDASDEDTGVAWAGYCLYMACSGLSACSAGQTCEVGDGCNRCSCASDGLGHGTTTCTTVSCACP